MMAFIVIDRIAMPKLKGLSSEKLAALALRRAPRASDVIVEIIDPTVSAPAWPEKEKA